MPCRNRLSMLNNVVDKFKNRMPKRHSHTTVNATIDRDSDIDYVDLEIHFIKASNLPKQDVVGSADPYFTANLDDRITFISRVIQNSLDPVWNDLWKIKNVPSNAELHVEIMDKDQGCPHDDFFGGFTTAVSAGLKEEKIKGRSRSHHFRSTFVLDISSTPSNDPHRAEFPYLFDGPVHFSQHVSPTAGRLTHLNDTRLYTTWKIFLTGVHIFFGDTYQSWNRNYHAAQSIFQGSTAIAVRSGIQAGHRMLYAHSAANGYGIIENGSGFMTLLQSSIINSSPPSSVSASGRPTIAFPKPALYTYIISADDDTLRFSETGAAFFVDMASKHALHSNCAERVRYSGEFHPRPEGGWQNFHGCTAKDQVHWELVIDNNSGTYAPDVHVLPILRRLLEHNFPGCAVYALSREDPALVESREACRAYALKCRGLQN